MGNVSPTTLQTLSNLLNLYLEPGTDRSKLLEIIESDTFVFRSFLQATSTPTLRNWHERLTAEQLGDLTLALANQVACQPLDLASDHEDATGNSTLVSACRSLMFVLDPDQVRDIELTARLAGSNPFLEEPHLAQAPRYYRHPLNTLYGTHLATRVLAVAEHLKQPDADLNACTSLLSLDESFLRELTHDPVADEASTDTASVFSEVLTRANLYASTLQLANRMEKTECLRETCSALFSTDQISIYQQRHGGWYNGTLQLDAGQSIIVSAASLGQPLTTLSHNMTVLDDEALAELTATEGIALPVLLDKNQPDSCVAVILLGLTNAKLERLIAREELVDTFLGIARGLFQVTPSKEIDLEDLDNRAREIIHEANNPISTVQNYLKVPSLKLGPEHEAQSTLEGISSELMRAADIIRIFRDIPDAAGQAQGACDINKVLRSIATLFDQGNEHIRFDYQFGSDVKADIHSNDFKQICTNLIKNAVEELSPGSTISLHTQSGLVMQNTSWVEITFSDNGPGIQTGVGDVFERGMSTKSGAHAGEGLAVVKQLTERNGGFISYRTSQAGTEFRVTLMQSQNNKQRAG